MFIHHLWLPLPQRSWDTVCSTKPKIFALWPFMEKVCWPCKETKRVRAKCLGWNMSRRSGKDSLRQWRWEGSHGKKPTVGNRFRQTEQHGDLVAGVWFGFLCSFALKVVTKLLDCNIKKTSNGKIDQPNTLHLCLVQGDKSIFKLSLALHSKEGERSTKSDKNSGKKELLSALPVTALPWLLGFLGKCLN